MRYCAALDHSSGEKETGFPPRKCTASLWWGHFYKAWKKGTGARLQEPGRGRPRGRDIRPGRAGARTWTPRAPGPRRAHCRISACGNSDPLPLGPRVLAPRPPTSPAASRPGSPRPQAPARASGSPARGAAPARRPGSEGAGSGPGAPDAGAGRALRRVCEDRGDGAARPPPPPRRPAARLGLVELLALGLQAVARSAAQHPRRHVLDAVHPADACAPGPGSARLSAYRSAARA